MSNEKSVKVEAQKVEPVTPSRGSDVIFSKSTFAKFKVHMDRLRQEEYRKNQPYGYFSKRD